MIVSIHQPNFLPWLGFFYKLIKSDIYIVLDNVQYTKGGIQNRNKIKTPQGEQWLTVPIKRSSFELTNKIEINYNTNWQLKHIKTLESNYRKAKYYDYYIDEILFLYNTKPRYLTDFNRSFLDFFIKALKIDIQVYTSSELIGNKEYQDKTERLVDLCKTVGGNAYYSGLGGASYQEEKVFNENNIGLMISDFKHPNYEQLWGDFIPNLSVLDLIFNEGIKAREIIRGNY